jgi:DNA-binding NtrC family response regulator
VDPKTKKAGLVSGPKLISHKIRLEIIDGPCRGLVTELPGPEARVGSETGVDLVIKDPTVSRLHLVLRIEGNDIRVIDPGSLNGSFVDGIQFRDAYARPDSIITIGESKLRLRMVQGLEELPISNASQMGGLLGQSVGMRLVYSFIERVAKSDLTVLIEGETGTGKELVAEAIHDASQRGQGPHRLLDCSAISPSLVEDALFGHVRGGFTGAITDQAGAIEFADGGTLFLDEIGELPLELQSKLLRVLEKRTIRRVGSPMDRRVNVRFVAATNRNLAREVELGRFRADLYHRLNGIRIQLPPLRERLEDIPLLVRHFEASMEASSSNRGPLGDHEIAALMERSFPGNVRELRNLVQQIHALGISLNAPEPGSMALAVPEKSIADTAPTAPIDMSGGFHSAKDRVVEAFERQYFADALRRSNGNISKAAQSSGVSRRFLHRAINTHGLRPRETKDSDDDDDDDKK